jgi:hypothetical protein
MVTAGTLRHRLSCSPASSPSSGINSTYPSVRIWPANSDRAVDRGTIAEEWSDTSLAQGAKESVPVIRILHTADWHTGQTLRGFSREHEHHKVFGRLEEIIVERNVDALIIAGDVFDSQNPSREAQQLF